VNLGSRWAVSSFVASLPVRGAAAARTIAPLAFALVTACSGSSSPPTSTAHAGAVEPAKPRELRFDDFVLREVEHRWGHVPVGCAQAVLLEVPARGFRWGESLEIVAHADRWIAGQIQFDVGGGVASTFFTNERHEVSRAEDVGDDARCRESTATPSASPAGSVGAPKGAGSPSVPAPSSAPSVADVAFTFDASLTGDPRRGVEIFRHEFQHETWDPKMDVSTPPLRAGQTIRIKLWGMRPIDWGGVVIEVSHFRLDPIDEVAWQSKLVDGRAKYVAMQAKNEAVSKESAAKWQAHSQDCTKRLKDADCADVARTLGPKPPPTPGITNTPPPPPRAETPPPKPSDGSIWVAGHWAWDGFHWSYWSPGFWRVPDDDRSGKHTATAPKLPPSPKTEAPGAPPVPGAVWTPGYWHWQASAWIWIEGAWRVPPVAGAKWRAFEWRVDASGVVRLDPGGWVLP
jgi:hypothetical protein